MVSSSIHALFERAHQGDLTARDAAYGLAFKRLRTIASALLQRERPGHTLQPTALVGELFLKLHRVQMRFLDEDHFFRISARAMRQVLIDHARMRNAAKKVAPEAVPDLLAGSGNGADIETLHAVKSVFEKLEKLDPAAASTVWLRSVEGLTLAEVCAAQGREIWRVRADYDFGVQWMADRITRQARSMSRATESDHRRISSGRRSGLGS